MKLSPYSIALARLLAEEIRRVGSLNMVEQLNQLHARSVVLRLGRILVAAEGVLAVVAPYVLLLPPVVGTVPLWLSSLHLAMTLDVVLFTSLYAVTFVAALRSVPLTRACL